MRFVIQGPTELEGEVHVSGSKNSALAILSASILLDQPVVLHNIPRIKDVETSLSILEHIGVKVKFLEGNTLLVDPTGISKNQVPYELASRMRASIYFLGPLANLMGSAKVYMPGGCSFGPRPINFHIEGLTKLGFNMDVEGGYVIAKRISKPKNVHIHLPFRSVGATIHIMITSAKMHGTVVRITNSALEPEVVDTANFLNRAGARIYNAGYDEITIEGVSKLSLDEYEIIPDRIEAGTFAVAGGILGKVVIRKVIREHVQSTLNKLEEAGVHLNWLDEYTLLVSRAERILPLSIQTAPFPGFPTDMQAQFMSLLTVADGTSIVKENIYPNRFNHAYEMIRMGANISIDNGVAIVEGVRKLKSAIVVASDLRASVSLVIAGMMAEGETIVEDIEHIDRGYENIERKLNMLGAKIRRES